MEGFVAINDPSVKVSISPNRTVKIGSSGGKASFEISITGEPWINTIVWKGYGENGTSVASSLIETTANSNTANHTYSVEYSFPQQSGIFADKYQIGCTITDYSGKSLKVSCPVEVGCFEKGTLILTERGNIKVEDLKKDDLLLSVNHFTGEFEYQPINIVINHGLNLYDIIYLHFDDGSVFNIMFQHGIFNLSKNEYSDIRTDNFKEFIGDDFAIIKNGKLTKAKLISANWEQKITESFTCLSRYNLNCFANNFLTISSDLYGLYNIFEFKNLKYDENEVRNGIDKFGLFDYNELSSAIDRANFDKYNLKYTKISIGKKLLTYNDLLRYIREELYGLIEKGEAPIH